MCFKLILPPSVTPGALAPRSEAAHHAFAVLAENPPALQCTAAWVCERSRGRWVKLETGEQKDLEMKTRRLLS